MRTPVALSLAAAASAASPNPAAALVAGVGGGGGAMQVVGAGGGSGGGGGAVLAGAHAQLAALNAELQTELAKHKEESAANADLLRKQADEHRDRRRRQGRGCRGQCAGGI